MDENGEYLTRFGIRPLAGTALADKGYVGIFEQRIGFSADGVHFKIVPMGPWIAHTDEPGFGFVYDSWRERFIIYDRIYGVDRRVGRVLTTDFESFSSPEIVLQPDAQDPVGREFYGMYTTRYEDMFVGCVQIYDTEPTEKSMLKMHGAIETQLAYSHDGEHWYRASRDRAFVGRGGAGTPTGGMTYVGAPVRTPDDYRRSPVCQSAMARPGQHSGTCGAAGDPGGPRQRRGTVCAPSSPQGLLHFMARSQAVSDLIGCERRSPALIWSRIYAFTGFP